MLKTIKKTKLTSKVTKFEDRIVTAHEALEAAGLNFTVCEAEVMNTTTGKISNRIKSLYRDDTGEEIGMVGMTYQPVQNITAFSYFDTICQMNGAQYTEALSINNGEKVILTASFPTSEVVGRYDEVMKQFRLVNGFNGKINWEVVYMLERLVCSNGLRGLVKDAASSYKFKHTKNIEVRMEETLKVLHGGMKYFDEFIAMSNELAQKQVDAKMVEQFLDDCFGKSESNQAKTKRENIMNYINNGIGNDGSTAWDLYNGVTEYVSHHHGNDAEKRNDWANFGGGVTLNEKAFKSACALVA